jgi:hypothetical protein
MTKKRDTVGKIATELMQQEAPTRDPIELEREMHKDYIKELFAIVDRDKTVYPTDFYVVVITKKEPLMQNVLRNYFFTRYSCPTPDYDQTVYKFHQKEQAIEFLWVIPSRDTCFMLKDNATKVAPEEQELLKFVMYFDDGTLFRVAKKLNCEEPDSPLLEKE